MEMIHRIAEIRARVGSWKLQGHRPVLVPTMGNLHAGHLRLLEEAQAHGDRVVASIFVNPLQFGAGEDYEDYPRTLDADVRALKRAGVHALFAPAVEELYGRPLDEQTRVIVPGLSEILCGAYRPGHFVGVTTVVNQLFNIVQPEVAVFGEKDFQQLTVIRRMAEDLRLPVHVIGVPTVREPDGLAMSSRNGYLNESERPVAPRLYAGLQAAAETVRGGHRDFPALEQEAMAALRTAGFRPEYVSVRRQVDLTLPQAGDHDLVILAAAWLGKTRLIDNVKF